LNKECSRINAELNEVQASLKELSINFKHLQDKNTVLTNELDVSKHKASKDADDISDLRFRLKDAGNKIEELKLFNKELNEKVSLQAELLEAEKNKV